MTLTAKDMFMARPFLDILIYGDSGTGKTKWASLAPRPYVGLTEPQGLATVAQHAPEATVEMIDEVGQWLSLIDDLKKGAPCKLDNGQPAYKFDRNGTTHTIQTLVADGLTDLHNKAKSFFVNQAGDSDWMKIQASFRQMLHDLRSLPLNVIATCLSTEVVDERNYRKVLPILYGQLQGLASQWFAATGYSRTIRLPDGTIGYQILFRGDNTYITKPAPGMPLSIIHTNEPGNISLGSMLLYNYGDSGEVPHMEHDSKDFVNKVKEEETETTKTETTKTTRRRRR